MTDTDLQQLTRLARRRVALKTGFAIHLLVYTLVNGGLLAAGLVRGGSGHLWQVAPLLGWGLGLAIHGVVTLLKLQGQGLRARLEAAELQRLRAGR